VADNRKLDTKFMRRALTLAKRAAGCTSPNPMVGAVIVRKGKVIAEGYHRRCGDDHAEIVALKKTGGTAKGATMYVTLEPCNHYGRTPPCVDAVIKSGIQKIVIAMQDPNPLTKGKSVIKMRKAGLDVIVGVLEEEAQELNRVFTKFITTGMPFVAVKFAQTLDGKIATAAGESKWITSEETRKYAGTLRNLYDAILVGRNTVEKDDPRLNAADPAKKIKKIIVDGKLSVSPRARFFGSTDPGDCFIAVSKEAPAMKVKDFRAKGINVIVCPQKKGLISIPFLFKKLAVEGITSILVEGGGQIVGSVLREGLADKVYAYIAPKIIGDAKALGSVTGLETKKLADTVGLTGIKIKKFKTDILWEAYVLRNS
jgi:diaminohydroxyphosphoribosylaminopyrimidine deaminase/5-amino-6-(5-phosphoribosylamino)uracil reductase